MDTINFGIGNQRQGMGVIVERPLNRRQSLGVERGVVVYEHRELRIEISKTGHELTATVASGAMRGLASSPRLPVVVAVGVVLFAFWRALFAGGSLVSHDIVATAAPFDAHRPESFTLENGPGDPINIHAHWEPLAADVRSGDFGWWNPDLAGGQPTMKGGLPIFNVGYLVAPGWFAPGLVAVIRALAAIGLAAGFCRAVGLSRLAALTGGLAFGFSGFMVGWMNWPQSSVAALAPGLLWAIERAIRDPRPWRAVPIGILLAAIVWANFPQVAVYLLLGSVIYTAARLISEFWPRQGAQSGRHARSLVMLGIAAAVVGLGLAAPHLVGFSEYLDWADTSHRGLGPGDSSAGPEYLLTAVTPAIWGSDAIGVPFFGTGNWVEYNVHAGASVVLLAMGGLVAGLRGDRRCRSVVIALSVVGFAGALVGYLGGPAGVFLGDIVGDKGGLMTRAKVLLSLSLALLAAFSVDAIGKCSHPIDQRRLSKVVRTTVLLLLLLSILMLPSVRHWIRVARAQSTLRESVATMWVSALAATAVVVVVGARLRQAITSTAAAGLVVGVVVFELLAFAMPVPTIVSRAERLEATPAHAVVADLLDPGERLAGEGRTFFPATTAHFGITDARGQNLKSPAIRRCYGRSIPTCCNVLEVALPRIPTSSTTLVPPHPCGTLSEWASGPSSAPARHRVASSSLLSGPLPLTQPRDPSWVAWRSLKAVFGR